MLNMTLTRLSPLCRFISGDSLPARSEAQINCQPAHSSGTDSHIDFGSFLAANSGHDGLNSATSDLDQGVEGPLSPNARILNSQLSDDDDDLTGIPARKFRKLVFGEQPVANTINADESIRKLIRMLDAVDLEADGQGQAAVEAALGSHASEMISDGGLDESFYVIDLSTVERLHTAWLKAMPRVSPFYAVKCNPDEGIVGMLAALGAGFDCASQGEIEQILAAGIPADRIIYAHPCKPPRQLQWAAKVGVNLATFDTESELLKVADIHPHCSLLLRVRADDTSARCQLGNKFGADPRDALHLLQIAKDLNLNVKGVSFHVGSGATNPGAFWSAIETAKSVFDVGRSLGFEMDMLDIGGGFCGGSFDAVGTVDLGGVPAAVNAALDAFFPSEECSSLRVIAEPGRYYAEASATYACIINGWRERQNDCSGLDTTDGRPQMDYWLSDGIYGAMNCLMYDHATLIPKGMRSPMLPHIVESDESVSYRTTLFGPTCDGLDTICRDVELPRLRTGDWILFPRFGAYTSAGACDFNGFPVSKAKRFYTYCTTSTKK